MPKLVPHLLFLLLWFAFPAGAQKTVKSLEKIRTVTLQPHKIKFDQPLPFASVQVVDARPDTTKLGYGTKKGYYKVVVEGNSVNAFQQLLAGSLAGKLNPAADQSLLVVIRQLWIKDLSFLEIDQRHLNVHASAPITWYSECTAKLEVYAQRSQGYVPLFRVDTVFGRERPLHKEGEELLNAPFAYCLQKLGRLNYARVAASPQRLTREQIDYFITQSVQHPILTDTTRQRGIYLTYADFLNNRVSSRDFEVQYGEVTDELYLTGKGNRELLTNFWGFCDGRKLFIRQDRSFYELVRQQNTFGFMADMHLQPVTGGYKAVGSDPGEILTYAGIFAIAEAIGSTDKGIYIPNQLNLETGKPY